MTRMSQFDQLNGRECIMRSGLREASVREVHIAANA